MLKDGKEYFLESSEEAVKLHLEMWRDMQQDLGDTPSSEARRDYKEEWLTQKGYACVRNNCFLCEFAHYQWLKSHYYRLPDCDFCPVDWSILSKYGCRCYDSYIHGESVIYRCAPISEILALPTKGEK